MRLCVTPVLSLETKHGATHQGTHWQIAVEKFLFDWKVSDGESVKHQILRFNDLFFSAYYDKKGNKHLDLRDLSEGLKQETVQVRMGERIYLARSKDHESVRIGFQRLLKVTERHLVIDFGNNRTATLIVGEHPWELFITSKNVLPPF